MMIIKKLDEPKTKTKKGLADNKITAAAGVSAIIFPSTMMMRDALGKILPDYFGIFTNILANC